MAWRILALVPNAGSGCGATVTSTSTSTGHGSHPALPDAAPGPRQGRRRRPRG
jgi:hypothetical protein